MRQTSTARQVIPQIDMSVCIGCGDCGPSCPHDALRIVAGQPVLDLERCTYCGTCETACPVGAITLPYEIILSYQQREGQDGRT